MALSEEEFDRYYRPAEVMEMLPPSWDDSSKIDAIAERLANGLFVAAAEHFQEKGGALRPFASIPVNCWGRWSPHAEHALWERGDCKFLRSSSAGYGNYHSDWQALNVRLEPRRVQRYLATLAPRRLDKPAVGDAPTEPLKPLSEAEQRRFCELFVAVHGAEGATESFARRAVAAMYPDRSVSRDGFRELLRSARELTGPIPKGRPRVAE